MTPILPGLWIEVRPQFSNQLEGLSKKVIGDNMVKINLNGVQNDNPPFMKGINYKLEIDTDGDEGKINNRHKNILKFETITSTLMRACEVHGEMIKKVKL